MQLEKVPLLSLSSEDVFFWDDISEYEAEDDYLIDEATVYFCTHDIVKIYCAGSITHKHRSNYTDTYVWVYSNKVK